MTVQPAAGSIQFDRSRRHLTVYLSGEIDAAVAPAMTELVLHHLQPGDEEVWLDLSAVTFCDSSGLRLLIQVHQAVESEGGRMIAYDPPPIVRTALSVIDPASELKVRTGNRWPT